MTFFLKKEKPSLKTSTTRTKTTRVAIFAIVATAVLSVGYIMALAILAPQQLAEATAALQTWHAVDVLELQILQLTL